MVNHTDYQLVKILMNHSKLKEIKTISTSQDTTIMSINCNLYINHTVQC